MGVRLREGVERVDEIAVAGGQKDDAGDDGAEHAEHDHDRQDAQCEPSADRCDHCQDDEDRGAHEDDGVVPAEKCTPACMAQYGHLWGQAEGEEVVHPDPRPVADPDDEDHGEDEPDHGVEDPAEEDVVASRAGHGRDDQGIANAEWDERADREDARQEEVATRELPGEQGRVEDRVGDRDVQDVERGRVQKTAFADKAGRLPGKEGRGSRFVARHQYLHPFLLQRRGFCDLISPVHVLDVQHPRRC